MTDSTPPSWSWTGMPLAVIDSILDPKTSPIGLRLVLTNAAEVARKMGKVSKVTGKPGEIAYISTREFYGMAHADYRSLMRHLPRQRTLVREENGEPMTKVNGHGMASGWSLRDRTKCIQVSLATDDFVDPTQVSLFFDPRQERWGQMNSHALRLLLWAFVIGGLGRFEFTTQQAREALGFMTVSAARKVIRSIVAWGQAEYGEDAFRRTEDGMALDLGWVLHQASMVTEPAPDDSDADVRAEERRRWLNWEGEAPVRKHRRMVQRMIERKAQPWLARLLGRATDAEIMAWHEQQMRQSQEAWDDWFASPVLVR